IAAAALDLGAVAVDVGLLKLAHIEIALDDPVVGDVIAAIEGKELRLICRSLRPGEDRPVVVVEKLDWCRPYHAGKIVGGAGDLMDPGVDAVPSEVAVGARDPRW